MASVNVSDKEHVQVPASAKSSGTDDRRRPPPAAGDKPLSYAKTSTQKKREEVEQAIISYLGKDETTSAMEDAFSSHVKRMQRYLDEDQQDDAMQEIQEVVNRHIRIARFGGSHRRMNTSPAPAPAPTSTYIPPGGQLPSSNNFVHLPTDSQPLQLTQQSQQTGSYMDMLLGQGDERQNCGPVMQSASLLYSQDSSQFQHHS